MSVLAEKAHDMAVEVKQEVAVVKQKLESHEDICGVRYDALNATMNEIKVGLKDQDKKMDKHLSKIYGRAWTAIIAVLFVFVTVAGVMATYIMTSTDNRLEQVEVHHGGS